MNNKGTGILLETGTNEIEILEFIIDGSVYGINVAKVREIISSKPVRYMPHCHEAVEGVFKPRDIVITVINLPKYLSGMEQEKSEKDLFIITGFNKLNIAFRVHSVVGISRISWERIQKPDTTVSGGGDGVITGIAQVADRLVSILDFEKIVADIAPQTTIQISEVDALGVRANNEIPVWVAEDSILLSQMIKTSLVKAGYTNIKMFTNGAELWSDLEKHRDADDIRKVVSLIITDIEMPQMDGHRLTKLIKTAPEFKALPVIIFSSLISEEMRKKGKELGANEQLSKPEIAHLIGIMDNLLNNK